MLERGAVRVPPATGVNAVAPPLPGEVFRSPAHVESARLGPRAEGSWVNVISTGVFARPSTENRPPDLAAMVLVCVAATRPKSRSLSPETAMAASTRALVKAAPDDCA